MRKKPRIRERCPLLLQKYSLWTSLNRLPPLSIFSRLSKISDTKITAAAGASLGFSWALGLGALEDGSPVSVSSTEGVLQPGALTFGNSTRFWLPAAAWLAIKVSS